MADLITGYAAKFESETTIAGEFREQLAPGCFARSLREKPDVLALLDHDYGRVLGRTTSGTLSLREDKVGLWFELNPNSATPEGQTAIGTVARQDVAGCSFGFRVREEEWEDGGRRLPLRIITDVELFEVTLTAIPAYKDTTAKLATQAGRDRASAARRRAAAAMWRRGIAL